MQTIFSLYVPSLPEGIQNLSPKNHEFVVVGYACNSCYAELKVKLYCDNQIDQLVYDDAPNNDNVFNDPRKVVNWTLNFMHPNGFEELFFIEGKPETFA